MGLDGEGFDRQQAALSAELGRLDQEARESVLLRIWRAVAEVLPAALLIGMWVLLQLLFTWAGPGFGTVVWWTHLAGFGFGVVFAVVSRSAVERRLRQRRA